MIISQIRIYAEVLEQGLDFKDYISKYVQKNKIVNIYTKKGRNEFSSDDSYVDRIRKCKDVDALVSVITDGNEEYPILMVEYSTAVPTDDHKMQRSDVYYWSSKFNIPIMKIYPDSKGMSQDFGGGDKFNDEMEMAISYKVGGLFYPIKWRNILNSDTLQTKLNALSCIYNSKEIDTIIGKVIDAVKKSSNFSHFFKLLKDDYFIQYKDVIETYNDVKLKSFIADSSRFKWQNSNKLISKINRFGHAMDPDRGVLYFTNMLIGLNNCITEIQVNRGADIKSRGGYYSLFDSTAHCEKLLKFVDTIIKQKNNVMSPNDAIYVFSCALNIESWNLFTKIKKSEFIISDVKLADFLDKCPSMSSKSIFFLSTKLILTDVNRNVICTVTWGTGPITKYLNSLKTLNFKPIEIKELNIKDAKEDVITFASVELYKKMMCKLIAVSYPGAQGDRCILIGQGRKVLRKYIDIIALKNNEMKVTVFLEECKENIANSRKDVEKLKEVTSSNVEKVGLLKLIQKIENIDNFDDIKISIGAKYTSVVPNYDVDYIFMFDINNSNSSLTVINYTVAIIDTTLLNEFSQLLDSNKKLKGSLVYDKIYVIK